MPNKLKQLPKDRPVDGQMRIRLKWCSMLTGYGLGMRYEFVCDDNYDVLSCDLWLFLLIFHSLLNFIFLRSFSLFIAVSLFFVY